MAQPLILYGAPEAIRTPGPRIRNPMLYPAELRGLFNLRTLLNKSPIWEFFQPILNNQPQNLATT